MTIYVLAGSAEGVWEEHALRKAVQEERFTRDYEPRYYKGEWVDEHDPEATGYIAYCWPAMMPGDCRDPDHELEGPFPAPDRTQVRGSLRRWIAIYGPAKGAYSLFE